LQSSLDNNKIRPPKLLRNLSDLYKQDLDLLKREKLINVNCPSCNSKKSKLQFRKMGFRFNACERCDTIFINPRPSIKCLEKFYTSSKSLNYWNIIFKKTEKIRKEKIFRPRLEMIKNISKNYQITKINKMVEIGAGFGWFCQLAKEKKFAKKITAIEPSSKFSKICRHISGIEVIESTIENYDKQLEADLIVAFELVSHLFNPKEFFRVCNRNLNNGGLLVITLPNYYGLDVQLLKNKSNYIMPHFLNIFNPNSIKHLLQSVGFNKIKVITPGLMDFHIMLNKIKSDDVKAKTYPFFQFILKNENQKFIDDLQSLLRKHNMSSHMLVSAQK